MKQVIHVICQPHPTGPSHNLVKSGRDSYVFPSIPLGHMIVECCYDMPTPDVAINEFLYIGHTVLALGN